MDQSYLFIKKYINGRRSLDPDFLQSILVLKEDFNYSYLLEAMKNYIDNKGIKHMSPDVLTRLADLFLFLVQYNSHFGIQNDLINKMIKEFPQFWKTFDSIFNGRLNNEYALVVLFSSVSNSMDKLNTFKLSLFVMEFIIEWLKKKKPKKEITLKDYYLFVLRDSGLGDTNKDLLYYFYSDSIDDLMAFAELFFSQKDEKKKKKKSWLFG